MSTFRLDCPHCRGTGEGVGGGSCGWCGGRGWVEVTYTDAQIEEMLQSELKGLATEEAYDALLDAHEELREALMVSDAASDTEEIVRAGRVIQKMAQTEEPSSERRERLTKLRLLADEVAGFRAWARGRIRFWAAQYETHGDAGSKAAQHEAEGVLVKLQKLTTPEIYP